MSINNKTIELIENELKSKIKNSQLIYAKKNNIKIGLRHDLYKVTTVDDRKYGVMICRGHHDDIKGDFDFILEVYPWENQGLEHKNRNELIKKRASETNVPFMIASLTRNIEDTKEALEVIEHLKEFKKTFVSDSYVEFELCECHLQRRTRMLNLILPEELSTKLDYSTVKGSLALANWLISKN